MLLSFNGKSYSAGSVDELGRVLDRFNASVQFELWAHSSTGQMLAMLRSGADAFLMYLRYDGDSGYTSRGHLDRSGVASYVLANGQVDEYPLAWSIDTEQCYRAIAYFFANDGARPDGIDWHKD